MSLISASAAAGACSGSTVNVTTAACTVLLSDGLPSSASRTCRRRRSHRLAIAFRRATSRQRALLHRVRVLALRKLQRPLLHLPEVLLLDRLCPLDERRDARVAGALREHVDDRPV